LLFHDTHHRAATAPEQMSRYDLGDYDGVLAFGAIIRDIYLQRCWAAQAWTWHEAADVRVFGPRPQAAPAGDLVWIGNWGDDERSEEIHEFLLAPVAALHLHARVYGVRYPETAQRRLSGAGCIYAGWLPNYRVPDTFACFGATVHIPRRPYATALPGIPTIRPFEALACGIPLISAPWDDCEGLFEADRDYLIANDGEHMRALLREVLHDRELARSLARQGRRTILARHTCAHRVDELLTICRSLGAERGALQPS
jgi:spore maturation protein CgeB